jgi:hypothetical protein
MNRISQRNNQKKEKSYVEFMKNCPKLGNKKLAQEISRIAAEFQ